MLKQFRTENNLLNDPILTFLQTCDKCEKIIQNSAKKLNILPIISFSELYIKGDRNGDDDYQRES